MPRATAEQLWRAFLRGAPTTRASSAVNQWAGVNTIATGAATVTISTTVVDSDSLIFTTVFAHAPAGSVGLVVHVGTISPGNFFTLVTADAQNAPRPLRVMWLVFKTQ